MNSRRLYRSNLDKIISGVSGGLGVYFEIDSLLIRVLFVVTTLGWGIGLLAYIILWIAMPRENSWREDAEFSQPALNENIQKSSRRSVFAVILILTGVIILLKNFIANFDIEYIIAVVIMAIGVYILYTSFRGKGAANEKE